MPTRVEAYGWSVDGQKAERYDGLTIEKHSVNGRKFLIVFNRKKGGAFGEEIPWTLLQEIMGAPDE